MKSVIDMPTVRLLYFWLKKCLDQVWVRELEHRTCSVSGAGRIGLGGREAAGEVQGKGAGGGGGKSDSGLEALACGLGL